MFKVCYIYSRRVLRYWALFPYNWDRVFVHLVWTWYLTLHGDWRFHVLSNNQIIIYEILKIDWKFLSHLMTGRNRCKTPSKDKISEVLILFITIKDLSLDIKQWLKKTLVPKTLFSRNTVCVFLYKT